MEALEVSYMLLLATALVAVGPAPERAAADDLRTVAERSGYRATARHDDVVVLGKRLAESSPRVRIGVLGKTFEGREIPLWVVADPPVAADPKKAPTGRLVVLLVGNIHAGEVCGKEALPLLARELAEGPKHPVLKDLIVAIVPIFNADGNERVAKDNRPGQDGPEEGMGRRQNAQGLDLNRDFMKLEAPETRALVQFLNTWDPALVVDTHATNGSFHRYTITYDGPKNPAGDRRLIDFARTVMLPDIRRRFETNTGRHAFFYGNFAQDHTEWTTFPALPRFGTTYIGLRNRLSVLSEAYSYAPFETRVLATRDFVRACLDYAASQRREIERHLTQVRDGTTAAGRAPQPDDRVAIRTEAVASPEPVTVLGFVEETQNGSEVSTGVPRDYRVKLVHDFRATETVRRPFAYLVPPTHQRVIEALQTHGIALGVLREDIELDVEVYRLDSLVRADRPHEGHRTLDVTVTARPEARRIAAGTIIVPIAQPLGTLAVYLLEPRSDDGLFTWNFFDDALAAGRDVPVLRVPAPTPLLTAPLSPLSGDRPARRPITFEALRSGALPSFAGNPTQVTWLDDGHLLQVRDGRSYKVAARTGRAEPYRDTAALARALATLPTIDEATAARLAGTGTGTRGRARGFTPRGRGGGSPWLIDPAGIGALVEYEDDLYYATFDGARAVRLTSRPGREEMPTFSPDGRFVAFVRDNDLWVVDLATQTERALTVGGSETFRQGKADWVYYEELLDRNWQAFWWSPDSQSIAFLQTDDAAVPRHTLVALVGAERNVEATPYPRPGEPIPRVRLGIVSRAGGAPRFADLSGYLEGGFLISHAGWFTGGTRVFAYVQDRAQTWLDLVTWPVDGGAPQRLFRETTRAWVESPGAPHFLSDGSILWLSERDGYRHLYHYAADGTLKRQVTSGPWEVRTVHRVDATSGVVLFSGTRASATGSQLYRVNVNINAEGGSIQCLTRGEGTHQVVVSPDGRTFVDRWSDHATPVRVTLRATDGEGTLLRTLDTNPVAGLDEYRFAPRTLQPITLRDGFVLESELIMPPDLDPGRSYPVWVRVYGGPHFPAVVDAWGGGAAWEQALAQEGYIVFRVDPRTASGKGAVSAWSGSRQLGVQELRDLSEALDGLKTRPYVDGARIGISGHSFGGFLAAYALCHSTLFAAGIASAPVTDWHEYDAFYTERYLGTPQDNPAGYQTSSVVAAARNLHGRLLIIHGGMDNNVSPRNTYRLVEALEQANKDFELMVYPSARHGIGGAHSDRLMIDFIRRTLGGPRDRAQPGTNDPEVRP
jgi:dipeptidyl aminopeptidase/acylaminoacyl peptidase